MLSDTSTPLRTVPRRTTNQVPLQTDNRDTPLNIIVTCYKLVSSEGLGPNSLQDSGRVTEACKTKAPDTCWHNSAGVGKHGPTPKTVSCNPSRLSPIYIMCVYIYSYEYTYVYKIYTQIYIYRVLSPRRPKPRYSGHTP